MHPRAKNALKLEGGVLPLHEAACERPLPYIELTKCYFLTKVIRPETFTQRMKVLAAQIDRQLQVGEWKHCAVYEDELKRLWPLHSQDREAKIAQFAKKYGFRMRFYRKRMCAIFDKCPPRRRRL